jgi:apolipoprotein N-acyltransferase
MLIALSVPPAGWWPLGIAGVALLGWLLGETGVGLGWRRRALLGFLTGLGLYGVTIFWFAEFNAIGAVLSMMVEAGFLALAAVLTPPGKSRSLGFVGALVLSDWLRTYIPFGGVPLGGIPLGQAAGPLGPVARVGGQLLVTGVVAVAALIFIESTKRWWRIVTAAAVVVALVIAGRVSPSGTAVGTMRVAAVQGGGKRGRRAIHNSAIAVFNAHVAASNLIKGPVDLILWPEDVISLSGPILGTTTAAQVGAIAAHYHAALLAGVTEDVGTDRFRNAEVVWNDQGQITGRYDKVHRVPFGEYIPGRSLIKHLVNLDVIPRDAIPGHGSGAVDTQAGRVGIAISFEVFFPARTRSAADAGGQVILIPTNTASYTSTQVPAAEVAAMRLRAWETGRDVVMVAPTGWSAVVDSRGRLLMRSGLGGAQVLQATVQRRTGETPYDRWGDWPAVGVAFLLVGAAWWAARRRDGRTDGRTDGRSDGRPGGRTVGGTAGLTSLG